MNRSVTECVPGPPCCTRPGLNGAVILSNENTKQKMPPCAMAICSGQFFFIPLQVTMTCIYERNNLERDVKQQPINHKHLT